MWRRLSAFGRLWTAAVMSELSLSILARPLSDQEWELHRLVASMSPPASYDARESRDQAAVRVGYCESVMNQVLDSPGARSLPSVELEALRHNVSDLARNRWLSALLSTAHLPHGWARPSGDDLRPVGTTALLLQELEGAPYRGSMSPLASVGFSLPTSAIAGRSVGGAGVQP